MFHDIFHSRMLMSSAKFDIKQETFWRGWKKYLCFATMDTLQRYLPNTSEPMPHLVWHYTNQAGFLGILDNCEIWMTKIQYLNDSKEFSLALELFNQGLQDLKKQGIHVNRRRYLEIQNLIEQYEASAVYVASFSAECDSLSQWRAYSAGSNGFSIAFKSDHLSYLANRMDAMFYECQYTDAKHRQAIEAFFQYQFQHKPELKRILTYEDPQSLELIEFVSDFTIIAPFLKHKGFKDEKEWRFVWRLNNIQQHEKEMVRAGNSTLIPYIKMPLKCEGENYPGIEGVVIGPTPHQKLSRESVRAALLRKGITFSLLQNSKVPFRNW